MARSITTRRPLWVEEVDFGDGTVGYATDGTPVDCVRFAKLGLIEGFEADVIVAGINHGSNLGDDITYSRHGRRGARGHRARPAGDRRLASSRRRASSTSASAARSTSPSPPRFTAGVVAELDDVPLEPGTLLNVNVPAGDPDGVEVTRLGKRIYRDELKLSEEDGPAAPALLGLRRRARLPRRAGHRPRRRRRRAASPSRRCTST